MRRREVIGLIGGAAAWPLAAQAQGPAVPVVGFLRSTPSEPFVHLATAFRQGLAEVGFVEGRNLAIECRYADNQPDRLPSFAADLVRRNVAVVVANGLAAQAAKALTATVPIVVVAGEDPVRLGLVASVNQPDGNITGVTFFAGSQLAAKRVEFLHELAPKAAAVAVLLDPTFPGSASELPNVEAALRTLRRQPIVVKVVGASRFDEAFATVVRAGAGAALVISSPVFTTNRHQIVALAAQHALPAIYDVREFVVAGGLISYAASISAAYRQAGVYAGRILKGAGPSDLPIVQPTKFELAINLKSARSLGLEIPPALLARADEVIE
jgi:putative ABC transport system substrate-binding protein